MSVCEPDYAKTTRPIIMRPWGGWVPHVQRKKLLHVGAELFILAKNNIFFHIGLGGCLQPECTSSILHVIVHTIFFLITFGDFSIFTGTIQGAAGLSE